MSWSEFWSMGGYALYVWGSYLTTLIVLGGEVVLLMRRRKRLPKRAPARVSTIDKARVDSRQQPEAESAS